MSKRKIIKSDEEWKRILSEEEFVVCRQKGTERAFKGKYYKYQKEGVYACVCCGESLFDSEDQYNSGSGWPSFYKPLNDEVLDEREDGSLGVMRTEVVCCCCGAHLGHVFDDGNLPMGSRRYCINSICLNFKEKLD